MINTKHCYISIMKTLKLTLLAVLFTFTANISAQTADEIISNYFENTGGHDAWSKVEGIKMTAKANAQGMEIPIEIVNLKDGRQYTKITFQGKELMQGVFDGKVLWSTNFMTQKAEKSDAEATANFLLQAKDFSTSIIGGELINFKEKGYAIELLGKETIDGVETFKVKLTKKPLTVDGAKVENISYYFFDIENFVPIVVHSEIPSGPAKGQMSESKMSDYDEVEGLYFPFSMSSGLKGQPGGQAVTIEKIELNPTVDAKEFAFPEEAEAAPKTDGGNKN